MATVRLIALALFASAAIAATIDFTTFPSGTPIADESVISDQFESVGVTFFSDFPNSPRVKTELGGILISGGPTGFFDELGMNFVVPVTSVTVSIIGSGLNISANLQVFDKDGGLLGAVQHTYTGPTGIESPFSFIAPSGKTIGSGIYNGGLNPSAAASIGALSFTPVPEPRNLFLLTAALASTFALKYRRS